MDEPRFAFDADVDWEKVSAASDHFCLPEYFRESLVELLRQLDSAGYAIVKLPDMEVDQDGMETWPVTQKPWSGIVRKRRSDGRLDLNGVETPFNDPQEALSLAGALIAAARHVQAANDA